MISCIYTLKGSYCSEVIHITLDLDLDLDFEIDSQLLMVYLSGLRKTYSSTKTSFC